MIMNKKGQTSIELIIVTAFILILSVLVLSQYFNYNSSTHALSLVKTEMVGILDDSDDFARVYFVDYTLAPSNSIDITVSIRTENLSASYFRDIFCVDDVSTGELRDTCLTQRGKAFKEKVKALENRLKSETAFNGPNTNIKVICRQCKD